MKTKLINQIIGIKYPIIMAPMFLVTNAKMMIEALNSGIGACIPALNFKTDQELRDAIKEIRKNTTSKGLGVNIIVNKSNRKMLQQLEACIELKIDFIITSLGNPKEVIESCQEKNIKVFCDVIDENYAKKVEELGADAIVAVNKNAGGHTGTMGSEELISKIKEKCSIPVISAGGVGTKKGVKEKLKQGYSGLSIGSPFIACEEADISIEYKQACVDYGSGDIVLTTKISGTPCTVINTPYVQKVGTHQNFIEKILTKNKKIKKWVKMITYFKGMKSIRAAAFSSTYKTVWCAGKSIEYTYDILPTKKIVQKFI